MTKGISVLWGAFTHSLAHALSHTRSLSHTHRTPCAAPKSNSEVIQQLMEMGFSDERCEKALRECDNDQNAAIELLLTGGSA